MSTQWRRRTRSNACSNGLAWSADGATMYYVDSGQRTVDAFDDDLDHGRARRRRTIHEVPAWLGTPGGMCIDVEGCLWVAMTTRAASHLSIRSAAPCAGSCGSNHRK